MGAKSFGPATVGTGSDFPVPQVDDGVYPASILKIKDNTGEWDGQSFDQYIVEWEIEDLYREDNTRETLAQFIRIPDGLYEDPPVLNDKSNLFMLMSAIGCDMDAPEVAPDDWIGRRAQLVVKNKKVEKGKSAGQIRPKIETLLPIERRPAQRGNARPAAAAQPAREPVAAGSAGSRPAQRRPQGEGDNF